MYSVVKSLPLTGSRQFIIIIIIYLLSCCLHCFILLGLQCLNYRVKFVKHSIKERCQVPALESHRTMTGCALFASNWKAL